MPLSTKLRTIPIKCCRTRWLAEYEARLASGQVSAHRPLPFSEPLTQSFGFNFIRLPAESMPEFVADGEIQELVKRNMPLVQQLKSSLRIAYKQRFFNECLMPLKDAESWAIGIH